MPKPNHAGLRVYRKNQTTDHHVGLYDATAAGLDTSGGRWVTVCEAHGTLCNHKTYRLAMHHLSVPYGWCEVCMDELKANAIPASSVFG